MKKIILAGIILTLTTAISIFVYFHMKKINPDEYVIRYGGKPTRGFPTLDECFYWSLRYDNYDGIIYDENTKRCYYMAKKGSFHAKKDDPPINSVQLPKYFVTDKVKDRYHANEKVKISDYQKL